MANSLRDETECGNTVPMAKAQQPVLEAAGREVVITNPDKVIFPQAGHTKLNPAVGRLIICRPFVAHRGDKPR